MRFVIKSFVGGPLETNAYLVIDEASKDAIVIDAPFDTADQIVTAARDAGVTITTIVVTHGHWDHIGALAKLRDSTGAPVLASELSRERLVNPGSSVMDLPAEIEGVEPDRLIGEGDSVSLGEETFTVMHMPGHEPGHIALYSESTDTFLGGDVLFPNGHGRLDIPGASEADMAISLGRLAVLPPTTVIYPGHGATTTIGDEAWLQHYRQEQMDR